MMPVHVGLPVNYTVLELQQLKGSDTLLRLVRARGWPLHAEAAWLKVKQQWSAVKKLHDALTEIGAAASGEAAGESIYYVWAASLTAVCVAALATLQLQQVVPAAPCRCSCVMEGFRSGRIRWSNLGPSRCMTTTKRWTGWCWSLRLT